jgi:hypothetical protein
MPAMTLREIAEQEKKRAIRLSEAITPGTQVRVRLDDQYADNGTRLPDKVFDAIYTGINLDWVFHVFVTGMEDGVEYTVPTDDIRSAMIDGKSVSIVSLIGE